MAAVLSYETIRSTRQLRTGQSLDAVSSLHSGGNLVGSGVMLYTWNENPVGTNEIAVVTGQNENLAAARPAPFGAPSHPVAIFWDSDGRNSFATLSRNESTNAQWPTVRSPWLLTNSVLAENNVSTRVILKVAQYCKLDFAGWDGFDAEPITAETVLSAVQLATLLPRSAGIPSVAPGGDGSIGFEWRPQGSPLKKVFLDVGPKTKIAAMFQPFVGNPFSVVRSGPAALTSDELSQWFNGHFNVGV